jgi:TolB-like protein/DNA-binding winged helix-turn-helix (wHTH) protein/tetratricopeptide (TPR) repeat protein
MDFQHPAAGTFRFGVFELDARSGELRRHGQKIRLPHQSFQILLLLLSRPGDVVTRDELRQALWTSETFVDFDVGLNSAVRKLREALEDEAGHPTFIETLPRRGYRFIAEVNAMPAIEPAAPLPASANEAGLPPAPLPTPRQRTRPIWIGAAVALVAAVALGTLYVRSREAASEIGSIAVLPFENLSGDTGQNYFADAVTDAVTTHLAQVSGLDVVSRTSAKLSKQPDVRISAIAGGLQVDAVLEGTVARSGNQVRITTQLVRGATERHIFARTYDGEVSGIFSLQQRIAGEIAAAAGRPLVDQPRGARAGRVVDPVAYDVYLKGMTASGLQRYDGYRTAVGYFEQAIARQPDFAEAHAALAQSQLQFLFGGPVSPHETIPKAEAAARRAIELDPTLPVPHRVLGQVLSLYYWKWDEANAARARARATALHAQLDEAPGGGLGLIQSDRIAKVIAAAELARTRDPLSFAAQVDVATAYRTSGQYDRAIAELRRALEITPGSTRALFQLGVTYVMMGRFDDAIREFEAALQSSQGRNPRFEAYRAYAYAMAGRPVDARRILHDLEARRSEEYVSSFGVALIYDVLGEKEAALTALERACEERAVEFAQARQYPAFKTIASEPRFAAVMKRVGLPD